MDLADTNVSSVPRLDSSLFPLPFDVIPDSVTCLKECAEHQIRQLLEREKSRNLSTPEEDCLDDGFVLCDLAAVVNKLLAWNYMFPRIKPFYALKCNPDPMVAAVLGQLSTGFDCASIAELRLAQDSLAPPNNTVTTKKNKYSVVYAHPQRAENDLDRALAMFEGQPSPAPLTFDGPEELYKVHRAYQKQLQNWEKTKIQHGTDNNDEQQQSPPPPPDMILRLLVPDGHSTIPLGEKFGAAESTLEFLIETAVELDLPVIGVSFHCGSGNHDPTAYSTAIQIAATAMETVNRVQGAAAAVENNKNNTKRCWLVDIGGGFPGHDGTGGDRGRFIGAAVEGRDTADYSDVETTAKIAKIVTPLLDEMFPTDGSSSSGRVEVISEPGRYFVEGAFALCSRIYRLTEELDSATGEVSRRHYYIAQGVQGVFKDCVLCGETFIPIPLSLKDGDSSSGNNTDGQATALVPSTVHGPSGEEYDVICRDYPLPKMGIGDWLIFDRMGAYTLSIAARNGRPPIRYVMSGGGGVGGVAEKTTE